MQCWPPESGTDLSEVEIICLCIDLASFMDLYFKTWSLCGEGVGCGIGPWCKEGENLKKNSQQFVFDCKERDNPKKILNKLFFILQRKEQPQNESPQVAFDCKERGNHKKILNKLLFIALLRYLCLREMQAARHCGLVG